MTENAYISALAEYALEKGLICAEDKICAVNGLIAVLGKTDFDFAEPPAEAQLPEILQALTKYAQERGLCGETGASADLFDTKLMGALMPWPSRVTETFRTLYDKSPEAATDWFYKLAMDSNYIRRERIARDLKWNYCGKYGALEITINLSKPEKDPRDIAAAAKLRGSGYPVCVLCRENEGYSGTLSHPARQNLRIVPVELAGEVWGFQYSPYVYYNEHCILLSPVHRPMRVDRLAAERLLDFAEKFPHYFIGSNADLPVVGGSILSHDHFQGGRHAMPMEKAGIETELHFPDYPEVRAGILNWPMSVIRLESEKKDRIIGLFEHILNLWRDYDDAENDILSRTGATPHSTVTPVARMKNGAFQTDIVLRNNRATNERPYGIFHPRESLHHIKKENIGLIEVMGLAILPGRLKGELEELAKALPSGRDIAAHPVLAKHADWCTEILDRHPEFSETNADEIFRTEIGAVFEQVLEDAGVFKRDESGRRAFLRFAEKCGAEVSR